MSSYAALPVPPVLGKRLQHMHALSQPPATLGEYVAASGGERTNEPISTSALCCSDESRHEITIDGETSYTHCVLDTFLLSQIENTVATVRSTSPLTGDVITLHLAPDGVKAEPPEAVISYGMLREGSGVVYDLLCPYVNAFGSREEYERWVEATPDAVTMLLSVEQAAEFARDLMRRGVEAPASPDGPH